MIRAVGSTLISAPELADCEERVDKELISKNNMTELYFEETDIEGFIKKLE